MTPDNKTKENWDVLKKEAVPHPSASENPLATGMFVEIVRTPEKRHFIRLRSRKRFFVFDPLLLPSLLKTLSYLDIEKYVKFPDEVVKEEKIADDIHD